MKRPLGAVIALVLIALVTLNPAFAQDTTGIRVVGSGLVNPVLESTQLENSIRGSFTFETTGTANGLDLLCQGGADVATATRTINADEGTKCTTNSIDYSEMRIAHNVVALVSRTDGTSPVCVTAADLNTLLAPSAEGQITNWNQLSGGAGDSSLTLVVPPAASSLYAVLDALVQGDGLRPDVQTADNDTDVIEAVQQNPAAVGIVSLPGALALGGEIRTLQVNANEVVGCTSPSADAVEAGSYPLNQSYYVYVNRANLTKLGLTELMTAVTGSAENAVLAGLGLTAVTPASAERNTLALDGTGEKRPYSAAVTSFQIPTQFSASATIGGSAVPREYVNGLLTAFQQAYPGATITLQTRGEVEGIRRLCNGEIDIALATSPLNADQEAACTANNVTLLPVELGKQAVVLVASGQSDYLTCLTTSQLTTIWSSESAKTANNLTTWNQVDASFPAEPMTLFTASAGDTYADLLMTRATGRSTPMRDDGFSNVDVLYRAAATANVAGGGGLTYMSWEEYQQVLGNNQDRIQLVAVDGGGGCIAPTEQTIADGSYLLAQSARLFIRESSLTNTTVQSFVWYLALDENFPALAGAGFQGLTFGSLPSLRERMQNAFRSAEEAAAAAAAEATPEATAEATAEATPGS
jgi:phosphate transport system substrate-binding protein